MIKGESNLKFYDKIIEQICIELGEKPFTTADIEILKYGKGKNIIEALQSMAPEHTDTNHALLPVKKEPVATPKIEDYILD